MNGIISGWNIPPRPGGPNWMEPDKAGKRVQVPTYSVLLETTDKGKTWLKSEASVFGQVTRISMTPQGTALGLNEYKDAFDYPSEVYRIDLHTGKSESAFRAKDRAITDVRAFAGSTHAIIAGYETAGTIYRSPIPGKLKVLTSDDLENWEEMKVDYRAVAHGAIIAGPDEDHLWIATDTGMILKLNRRVGSRAIKSEKRAARTNTPRDKRFRSRLRASASSSPKTPDPAPAERSA